MTETALVSVFCPDQSGLVAAITGRLFDLGANIGDASFAVLGGGAEFTAVCELPTAISGETVAAELRRLPPIAAAGDAEVTVRPFTPRPDHGPTGEVTHRITVSGGDQPGLIARLCETFVQFKANIVTLGAGRAPELGAGRYAIRFAVWIPPESADACLATVRNTAENLQMDCDWEAV